MSYSEEQSGSQTMSMSAQQVKRRSKNVRSGKEKERQRTYRQTEGSRGTDKGGKKRVGGVWALTLTGPIRPSQDGALLDLAEGLEQPPDVVLALLLAEHSHKQLPVFWIGREEGGREGGRVEERREQTNATADGTVLLS